MTYRIRNWDEYYENNRTRGMKKLSWIPIPIQLDGDGYTLIMEKEDGPAIFGAFIATLEVAARCTPRGTLSRGAGIPHDPASIARLTRMKVPEIGRMLQVCTEECKWIELIDMQEGAEIPHESATKAQEGAGKVPSLESDSRESDRKNTTQRTETPTLPRSTRVYESDAQEIYQAYPRKIGKDEGIKRIKQALKAIPKDELLAITKKYAESVVGKDTEYIPYPSTWFNKKRYLDETFKEPDTEETSMDGVAGAAAYEDVC